MKRVAIRFGLLAVALILLMQLSKYSLLTRGLKDEFLTAFFAVLFIGFGIIASKLIFKPKSKITTKTNTNIKAIHSPNGQHDKPDLARIEALGISKREYEVLGQMALGKSNREIADQLFISESTVKTHVSSLLVKLDAKRRTQAVNIAKEIRIIV